MYCHMRKKELQGNLLHRVCCLKKIAVPARFCKWRESTFRSSKTGSLKVAPLVSKQKKRTSDIRAHNFVSVWSWGWEREQCAYVAVKTWLQDGILIIWSVSWLVHTYRVWIEFAVSRSGRHFGVIVGALSEKGLGFCSVVWVLGSSSLSYFICFCCLIVLSLSSQYAAIVFVSTVF